MRSKQNHCEAITPKKNTTKISKLTVSCKKGNETTSIKDLLPPFLQNMLSGYPSLTPLKKQPEILLSPSPVKKDLFSQLLGSQIKNSSPYNSHLSNQNSMIMEEQDNQYMDDQSIRSNSQENSQMSDSENDCIWDDENGIKKRKRKSTVQIKMLKQELQGECNWTKQKIQKMAEVTGLSQSQVYKWCWDQKKKNMKSKQHQKRKLIKKEFSNKPDQLDCKQQDYEMIKKIQASEFSFDEARTKLKVGAILEEVDLNTEKKINKKLIFN